MKLKEKLKMAARKARKRSTKKAVAVVGSSALAVPAGMEDEFAGFINRDKASAVAAGWPYLSTQGSTPVMTLSGQPVGSGGKDGKGSPAIEAVILGGARINQYYAGEYVPGKSTPPKCYAIADPLWEAGEVENKIAPPADLKTKEADSCVECRFNAFGSGRGNAKACKNTVRLAMLPAASDDFAKADGLMLSAPPTAMKTWAAYVAPLTAVNRPVLSVVTEIEKVPSETGAGFSLKFTTLKPIQDKTTLRMIMARAKGDGGTALTQPPPAIGAEGGAKPSRRRKVVKKGKKKAARKKASRK
jgi:hypothetical protein